MQQGRAEACVQRGFVQFSEIRNMPFDSAINDLKKTTLQSIRGLLGKLVYLSELRRPDGKYRHWGLERVHGEASAERAIAEAHDATVTQILRTPLQHMVQDAVTSSQASGVQPEVYVAELSSRTPELLPSTAARHSARHFSAVLRALASLLKRR